MENERVRSKDGDGCTLDAQWLMEDGKVYTRGFRALLFIVINQSFVTGNLLSCSRSLQTLGPWYSTHFSFSFSFSASSPLFSFFLSVATICSPSKMLVVEKSGRLNLKKDWTKGWKWGQRVNERETKIYGNLVKRLPKLIRFAQFSMNKTISPLLVCCKRVDTVPSNNYNFIKEMLREENFFHQTDIKGCELFFNWKDSRISLS